MTWDLVTDDAPGPTWGAGASGTELPGALKGN